MLDLDQKIKGEHLDTNTRLQIERGASIINTLTLQDAADRARKSFNTDPVMGMMMKHEVA